MKVTLQRQQSTRRKHVTPKKSETYIYIYIYIYAWYPKCRIFMRRMCPPLWGDGGGGQSTKNEEETGRNEQCIHERVLKL